MNSNTKISQFLPDQESLSEIFGAYMARGLTFNVQHDAYFGGYVLKVRFGEGSNAVPVFPLPAEKMQTPEEAQQWLEQVRDNELAGFARPH